MTVESTDVLELRSTIVKRIESAQEELSAIDRVLALLGVEHEEFHATTPHGNGELRLNSDATLTENLATIARHNGGILRCIDAAQMLVDQGIGKYANRAAAYSSFYGPITRDKRFTKVDKGVFRFDDGQQPAAPSNGQRKHGSALAGLAKGRNHNVAHLPEKFATFPLHTLHGVSYRDAAVMIAKHNGGILNMSDYNAVMWHADMCPKAKTPGDVGNLAHGSIQHGGFFKRLGRGVYKLTR